MHNVVIEWFGESFSNLHPLLQRLHQKGGELSGQVDICYGEGIAGYIGKRIALKIGLPPVPGKTDFTVIISHDERSLYWSRVFDNQHRVDSVFTPYGYYPEGEWKETTGVLTVGLGVEIKQGDWHWQPKKIEYMGFSFPTILMPKTKAYKKIVNGQYRFYVGMSLPLLGEILSYSGDLTATV